MCNPRHVTVRHILRQDSASPSPGENSTDELAHGDAAVAPHGSQVRPEKKVKFGFQFTAAIPGVQDLHAVVLGDEALVLLVECEILFFEKP